MTDKEYEIKVIELKNKIKTLIRQLINEDRENIKIKDYEFRYSSITNKFNVRCNDILDGRYFNIKEIYDFMYELYETEELKKARFDTITTNNKNDMFRQLEALQ